MTKTDFYPENDLAILILTPGSGVTTASLPPRSRRHELCHPRAPSRRTRLPSFASIKALAEYEKLLDEVVNDEARIARGVLRRAAESPSATSPRSAAKPVGYAIWFYSYSTFTGRHGIYLEDLLRRSRSIAAPASARRFSTTLAERCVAEELTRFEWSVLDWNEPSIGFYRSLGAVPLDGWTGYRLDGRGARAARSRETMSVPIAIVAAVAKNGVIGVDGGLPWRMKADMKKFRAITMGKPLVMGRKTFESISRVLDGRDVIVVTRQTDFAPAGVFVAASLEAALTLAEKRAAARGADEICIGGGGEIYRGGDAACRPPSHHACRGGAGGRHAVSGDLAGRMD